MKINKVIERAEKYRTLGRFDKNSAIDYINDALYEITKRQSFKIDEIIYRFRVNPVKLTKKLIKLESVDFGSEENNEKYSLRINQNNDIWVFKKDKNNQFKKIGINNKTEIAEINVIYTGYKEVSESDETIDFPSEFETAIVYFLRSKMLEETGEIEQSQYFYQAYEREVLRKSSPKVDVVSQPSEYSLL